MIVKPTSPRVRQRRSSHSPGRDWVLELEIALPAVDPERLLSECEEFLVDDTAGRSIGVVDVIETGANGLVTGLLVAGGWFGRRKLRVDVGAIDSLLPAERRIIVCEAVSRGLGARPG
jgi:hypothetical protein